MSQPSPEPSVTVGVPKETTPGEQRMAVVPESVRTLARAGVRVLVEHGAGAAACFPDGAGADRPAAGRPGGHRHAAPLVQPELARQLARAVPGPSWRWSCRPMRNC
jgi:hypothetical protein